MIRLRQPLALLGVLSLLIGMAAPLSALCAQPAMSAAPPCHEQVDSAASHETPMAHRDAPSGTVDTHTQGDEPCCLIGPCCLRAVATVVHLEIDRASVPAAPIVRSAGVDLSQTMQVAHVYEAAWRPPPHAPPIYLMLGRLLT